MKSFKIQKNKYLDREVLSYYNCDYLGYQKEGNPDYINKLKNHSKKLEIDLIEEFIKAFVIIEKDLKTLCKNHYNDNFIICCAPRSKADKSYIQSQLMFRKVVSSVADFLGYANATSAIKRTKDTKTTHSWHLESNAGDMPYVGITKDTCDIDEKLIKGKNIILVDDVYTEGVNVDEDCIQTLFDIGARNVILYTIAKVVRR